MEGHVTMGKDQTNEPTIYHFFPNGKSNCMAITSGYVVFKICASSRIMASGNVLNCTDTSRSVKLLKNSVIKTPVSKKVLMLLDCRHESHLRNFLRYQESRIYHMKAWIYLAPSLSPHQDSDISSRHQDRTIVSH
jgi:hypothetical protein